MAKSESIDVLPKDLETLKTILERFVPELEVRAFGSRVNGTAKKFSDLDLALMTNAPLTIGRLAELRDALSDSDLPFRVDIVDWASISETFRKIISANSALIQKGGTEVASKRTL